MKHLWRIVAIVSLVGNILLGYCFVSYQTKCQTFKRNVMDNIPVMYLDKVQVKDF